MAVPVVVDFTTNATTSTPSLVLTKPSGAQNDDLYMLIVLNDNATNTQQFDTFVDGDGNTWNLIGEAGDQTADVHVAAFWRHVDGNEGATVSVPAQSSNDMVGWYLHITGARILGTPVHDIGNSASLASNTTIVYPGFKTTFKDCLVFCISAYDGGDTTALNVSGSGWVQGDFNRAGTGTGNVAGQWATKGVTTPGQTGDMTETVTPSDGRIGFQFAIAREGAPPSSIRDSVLEALDEIWAFRGIADHVSSSTYDTVEGGVYYRAHGYSRVGNGNVHVRIKDKGLDT